MPISNKIGGLGEELIAQIVRLITEHKDPEKIIIFGSRAKDDFKRTSDIDIAIVDKNWTDKDTNLIKHLLDEKIKTPLKFDVINFYSLTKESLKKNILNIGRVVYER